MKKFLVISAVILMSIVIGCADKNSIAQAAETASPITNIPQTTTDDSKASDQIKHTIMAFDLEGLAGDGSRKWDVKGQSAELVTENQIKLNNITASSYGPETQATITADTGVYDKVKSNVHLEQNVKAVIENTGKGTEDFLGLSGTAEYASKSNNAGSNADKPKKTKTVITCDAEVEFNYAKNEGYFNKNVHVVNDEGTIDADKITVYLDSVTKAVKIIVAEGNVQIRRGENTTYSDKATYIEAYKKIVLTGQPKLVIYQEGNLQTEFMQPAKK